MIFMLFTIWLIKVGEMVVVKEVVYEERAQQFNRDHHLRDIFLMLLLLLKVLNVSLQKQPELMSSRLY